MRKKWFKRFSPVIITALAFWTSGIKAIEPSVYFPGDTFFYLEIQAPDSSLPKLKKLFFSLMSPKKAQAEWEAFEEIFLEDYGLNMLSIDSIKSAGFDTSSPIGAGFRYVPFKIKDKTSYQKLSTLIISTLNTDKSYSFLKNTLINKSTANEKNSKFNIKEVDAEKLLYITGGKNVFFIKKTSSAIIISQDTEYIHNFKPTNLYRLDNNTAYTRFKSILKSTRFESDQVASFFVNTPLADNPYRENPRLILDNFLMDSRFMKDITLKSEFISGNVRINAAGLRMTMDYYFADKILDDSNNYLGNFLRFQNQNFFPDNMNQDPFAYGKIQCNFSQLSSKPSSDTGFDRNVLAKFIGGLLDNEPIEIPENMEYLFRDNISALILEIPDFKLLNKLYLWKGYLSVTYNPEYLSALKDFFQKLQTSAAEKPGKFLINYKENKDKQYWDISILKMVSKYDRKKDEIISEEKIYKLYVIIDNTQIIITHDLSLLTQKFPSAPLPVYAKTDPGNTGNNQILFAFLDLKKFLKYVNEGSLALPLKGYASYFEKGKNLIIKVNRNSNIISEELILNIDK